MRLIAYLRIHALAVLLSLAGAEDIHAQPYNPYQDVVFADALVNVTVPAASQPLPNVGQAMHVIQVVIPSLAVEATGLQVRMEWSRGGMDWRPMGPDITVAPVLGYGIGATDVVAYMAYYGVFRALRVNSLTAPPGGAPMSVRYYGHVVPVVPFVTLEQTRWAF